MPDYSTLANNLLSYWSMDNTQPPYQQWDYTNRRHLYSAAGTVVDGKFGSAIEDSSYYTTQSLLGGYPNLTVCFWFKVPAVANITFFESFLAFPPMGLKIYMIPGGPCLYAQWGAYAAGTIAYAPGAYSPSLDEWHFFRFQYDAAAGSATIVIDETTTNTVPANTGNINFISGAVYVNSTDSTVDDMAVWARLLTAEEIAAIYNDGEGAAIGDLIQITEATTECSVAIPCCEENPYEYEAAAATSSGVTTGSDCIVRPSVSFDPIQGSYVSFPTYVTIYSSDPAATIYYTTDGTDPTTASTVYSVPVEVTGPEVQIRAYASRAGCDGPIGVASYAVIPDDLVIRWDLICETTPPADQAGIWNVFAPDGVQDYQWQLGVTIPIGLTFTIQKIIIYETNSAGHWNTGQAWSTQQFNDTRPWGPINFNTFPLVLWDTVPSQVNGAYSTAFMTDFFPIPLVAGSYTWQCYGQIQRTLAGSHFKCQLHMMNGDIYTQMIRAADCTATPPDPTDCSPIPALTVTAGCNEIVITWDNTEVVDTWNLYRVNPDDTVVEVAATYGDGTYTDTGLETGSTFCYYVTRKLTSCPDASSTDPEAACAQVLGVPTLTVTADKDTITSGETVTFTIASSGLGVTPPCHQILIERSMGGITNYTLAAGTTSWTNAPTATASYEFQVCNGCGSAYVIVNVTVIVPTCLNVSKCYIDPNLMEDCCRDTDTLYTPPTACSGNVYKWTGEFNQYYDPATCYYSIPDECTESQGNKFYVINQVNASHKQVAIIGSVYYTIGTDTWTMLIANGTSWYFWYGTKSGGVSPLGTYTHSNAIFNYGSSVATITVQATPV